MILRMYSRTVSLKPVCSLLCSFCHLHPLIVGSRLSPEAVDQHVTSMAVLMSEMADSAQACDQLSFRYMQDLKTQRANHAVAVSASCERQI